MNVKNKIQSVVLKMKEKIIRLLLIIKHLKRPNMQSIYYAHERLLGLSDNRKRE